MMKEVSKILELKNLSVEIEKNRILENINLEISEGEVTAIIGPNGAGKTILLKTLLGLLPYKGELSWRKGIKIGYVPQRMEIETDIPLTVREFFYLRNETGISDKKIKEVLRSVQLEEKILEAGLGGISVGQRQRVLVAWAVLSRPQVLLFDEPTADIDIHGQQSVYQMLHRLQDAMNLTIVLISHDLNVVYKYAQKVLCLNRRTICFGSPKEVFSPTHLMELYGGERAFYHHLEH